MSFDNVQEGQGTLDDMCIVEWVCKLYMISFILIFKVENEDRENIPIE